MAKKKANPQKLQTEIQLQQSKLRSLELLDTELDQKIGRLTKQRQDIRTKAQKLKYALQQNQQRLQSLQGPH